MKKLLLFTCLLLGLVGNSQAQKYVGRFYGDGLGLSNVTAGITLTNSTDAPGKLNASATAIGTNLANVAMGTVTVNQVYYPYTNLAGWFRSDGMLMGTNALTLNATTNTTTMKARDSIAETNYFGATADGKITTSGGVMYIQQAAGNVYVFGQSSPTGDGHVVAGDFNGSGVGLTNVPISGLVSPTNGWGSQVINLLTPEISTNMAAGITIANNGVSGFNTAGTSYEHWVGYLKASGSDQPFIVPTTMYLNGVPGGGTWYATNGNLSRAQVDFSLNKFTNFLHTP